MKILRSLQKNLASIIDAINRYPLTVVFLIVIAVINSMAIHDSVDSYTKYLLTLIIGAMISIVAEQSYERFFKKQSSRIIAYLVTVSLTVIYYFTIAAAPNMEIISSTKTAVIAFSLFMAFIAIPSIKSKITFNESFLASFKALFITLVFSFVFASGLNLIIVAIDNLLFTLNFKVYLHVLNLIGSLFMPILFLANIPHYQGNRDGEISSDRERDIRLAVSSPKQFTILMSYIIIPLIVIYTLILLSYIAINITGNFWTENLMEQLLVSYSIIGIIVYILSCSIDNKITTLFQKVFPKVLIVIVLFQTVASTLKINEMGLTHGRYYVIMFGVFALLSGLIFSLLPVRKNGYIVAILLVFSIVSITPPVDAFTLSKVNQTKLLQSVLIKNNMLNNDVITPNPNISKEDKILITKTANYLAMMNYGDQIKWIPSNQSLYSQFNNIFGFGEIYDNNDYENRGSRYVYFNINNDSLDISQYSHMSTLFVNTEGSTAQETIVINDGNKVYEVVQVKDGHDLHIQLQRKDGEKLISLNSLKIVEELFASDTLIDNELTMEQATFKVENDKAIMTVVINSTSKYENNYDIDGYIFILIK